MERVLKPDIKHKTLDNLVVRQVKEFLDDTCTDDDVDRRVRCTVILTININNRNYNCRNTFITPSLSFVSAIYFASFFKSGWPFAMQ